MMPNRAAAIVMSTEAVHNTGMLNFWCSARSMPARPTSRNVAGVSGLTGNPVVIWPSSAARATSTGGTPSRCAALATTGSTPK